MLNISVPKDNRELSPSRPILKPYIKVSSVFNSRVKMRPLIRDLSFPGPTKYNASNYMSFGKQP